MLKIFTMFFCLISTNQALASAPTPWQISLQTPASQVMQELYEFHNFLLWITGGIVLFVTALLVYVCIRYSAKMNPIPAKFTHNLAIEIIWTVIPIIILIIIALPSFRILRVAEKIPKADMTIKVAGYQWYWNYKYIDPDYGKIQFDSNRIEDNDLLAGQQRLLDVDNRLIIPQNTTVKFLVTSGDVIHSFAIPAFGIKIDAVPGRVNETWTRISKKGVYYGQCSELCGINHGFMPIAIEVVSEEEFQNWLTTARLKFALRNVNTLYSLKY